MLENKRGDEGCGEYQIVTTNYNEINNMEVVWQTRRSR